MRRRRLAAVTPPHGMVSLWRLPRAISFDTFVNVKLRGPFGVKHSSISAFEDNFSAYIPFQYDFNRKSIFPQATSSDFIL